MGYLERLLQKAPNQKTLKQSNKNARQEKAGRKRGEGTGEKTGKREKNSRSDRFFWVHPVDVFSSKA